VPGPAILDPAQLQALLDVLLARGYRVIGPTLQHGAVVLADITTADQLPHGVRDEQAPGHYRATTADDDRIFAWATPAQSPKSWLFPPDALLWRGRRTEDGFEVEPDGPAADPRPLALIGVRGCDLAAIGIQDRVLLGRASTDTHYGERRQRAFVVAVTCGTPAATCFCTSMQTGPKPGAGADLTLTELGGPHRLLVESPSCVGAEVLAELPTRPAEPGEVEAAGGVVAAAVAAMGRSLDTTQLHDLLLSSAESHRWDDVASRCLACTNCTTVCPTCFCTSIEDVSDLTGDLDERHRVWDSCFSMEYSRLHGGAVRTWVGSRYRQWLTHKLATWHDQFGTSGCVGCGRCITWCPAGIDLTVEVDALRELAAARETLAAGATRGPRRHRPVQEP
jgi:ferredoxin